MHRNIRWMILFCVVLIIRSTLPLVTHAQQISAPNMLSQAMSQALKEENVTGAVWAVVDRQSLIVDAAGIKNNASGEPLSPNDRVHVGSVTKTLVSVAILRLITQQVFTLNTPVEELLPTIQFDNQWQTPITVRHLLDHTAGLEDLRLWQMFSEQVTPTTPLSAAFRDPSVLKIRTKPGSVFSYSNIGYTLLGMIIETVTAERYETYLDRALLQPLGMNRSTFEFISQIGPHGDSTLAMGHLDNGTPQAALPIYLRPAGQFTTTAYDMGLFLRFLMSDGTINGKVFVDYALLSAMGNPINTDAAHSGLSIGYSLGLQKRDRYQRIGLAHSGNIIGYHAMIYLFPKEQKAFFVSHNMDSETANYEKFNQILLESLNPNPASIEETKAIPETINPWEGTYVLVTSRFEKFSYLDVLSGFIQVSKKQNHMQLKPFQDDVQQLEFVGDNQFQASNRVLASHVFYQNEQQERFISDGLKTYKKISGWYILVLWISFLLGIIGLGYILFAGMLSFIKHKRNFIENPLSMPFFVVILLFLSIPFFITQSFIALGDMTIASVLVTIVSILLPISLIFGTFKSIKTIKSGWVAHLNIVALIAATQWMIVLGFWGLLPLQLWV